MAAGVGAPARRGPIGIFEISAAFLRQRNWRSSLMLLPLQGGWAFSEPSCACRSAVSRLIHRPKQRPDGNTRTVLGRSPQCGERFAHIGFRVQQATTMKCKRASAPERLLVKLL